MTGEGGGGLEQLRLVREGEDMPEPAGKKTDDRFVVDLSTREFEVNEIVAGKVASLEGVFVRAGQLVRVVRDAKAPMLERAAGAPTLTDIPQSIVRERITQSVRFRKRKKTVEVPRWCVAAVADRGEWPGGRLIEGVVEAPVLRPDGSVLKSRGYDAGTGLLLEGDVELEQLPDAPTQEEAHAAGEQLLEVVADFPFATPAHQSAWLAFALTPFGRWAFDGPLPLMLADGNVAGSGKSKLVDCVALLATGRTAPRSAPTEDNEEWRKRIMSVALAGDQLVMIDNIDGAFGSPALDGALTATSVGDRILGEKGRQQVPLRAMWCATGNNVQLKGDLRRRVLHMRLESPHERPELRTDLRHPELISWVRANRSRLVTQALLIFRGFVAAGCPQTPGVAWGSYEGWHKLVRGAVVWAGFEDPEKTREDLVGASDPVTAAFRVLITSWRELWEGKALTLSEVLSVLAPNEVRPLVGPALALKEALGTLCPTRDGGLPNGMSLAKRLSAYLGRPGPEGMRLVRGAKDRTGVLAWSVQRPTAGVAGVAGVVSAPTHTCARTPIEIENNTSNTSKNEQEGS